MDFFWATKFLRQAMHSLLCDLGSGSGTGNAYLRVADKEERLLLLLRLSPSDDRQEVHLATFYES